jgi:hypothetical protein
MCSSNYGPPHFAVSSTLLLLCQHPILKSPQPLFINSCESWGVTPTFTISSLFSFSDVTLSSVHVFQQICQVNWICTGHPLNLDSISTSAHKTGLHQMNVQITVCCYTRVHAAPGDISSALHWIDTSSLNAEKNRRSAAPTALTWRNRKRPCSVTYDALTA